MEHRALQGYDRLFGLIGYPLGHSFSKTYFVEKFRLEGITGAFYENFPIPSIEMFPQLWKDYPNLIGCNVTIPYKEQVIPYLDALDPGAWAVGAVNTVKREKGKLTGYNTDIIGFERSLRELIGTPPSGLCALVLGTGGAAKAVIYVLDQLGITSAKVSRTPGKGDFIYEELNREVVAKHRLIVQTTPLGMSPHNNTFPALAYEGIGGQHWCFDLVYNPEKTLFLDKAASQGAQTMNGLPMLHGQAKVAWAIWNA